MDDDQAPPGAAAVARELAESVRRAAAGEATVAEAAAVWGRVFAAAPTGDLALAVRMLALRIEAARGSDREEETH